MRSENHNGEDSSSRAMGKNTGNVINELCPVDEHAHDKSGYLFIKPDIAAVCIEAGGNGCECNIGLVFTFAVSGPAQTGA